MSQQFPGSVVLTQNSAGHVSITSMSKCTAGHIHAYFGGKLPGNNSTCEVETTPFVTENPLVSEKRGFIGKKYANLRLL
jgi:hypothetical protein